jgi:hypothetical protein
MQHAASAVPVRQALRCETSAGSCQAASISFCWRRIVDVGARRHDHGVGAEQALQTLKTR